jgi:tRNA (Thr-GGU) A37 N-methylase
MGRKEDDSMDILLQPVGTVTTPRRKNMDDHWDSGVAKIQLDPERFTPEVLTGLEEFSHSGSVLFHA